MVEEGEGLRRGLGSRPDGDVLCQSRLEMRAWRRRGVILLFWGRLPKWGRGGGNWYSQACLGFYLFFLGSGGRAFKQFVVS